MHSSNVLWTLTALVSASALNVHRLTHVCRSHAAARSSSARACAGEGEGEGADGADGSSGDDADWRAMRARLIAQEDADGSESPRAPGEAASYVYESPLIEKGSVILGGTEQSFGFALRQQYFHKSVMLLLQHDEGFTKGIILNRPSGLELDGWRVWFGGDVAEGGMFRGEKANPAVHVQEIVCLHQLDSEAAQRLSMSIIPGVSYTSLEGAQEMVKSGAATKADFWVFVGYAGWGPGQLQGELERDSWFVASADGATLLKDLINSGTELPPPSAGSAAGDGLATWDKLMDSIGRDTQVANSRGSLADRMLQEWVRVYLNPRPPASERVRTLWPAGSSAEASADDEAAAAKADKSGVGVGAVLRCGPDPADRFLLSDQFLLKSLMLVLAEMPNGGPLVACALNRPTANLVQFHDADRSRRCINFGGDGRLRGGGGGLDIDQNGLMWLHTQPGHGGTAIGDSGIWRMPALEAAEMIRKGEAKLQDFLLVSGVCGFMRSEMDSMLTKQELVAVDNASSLWPALWGLADVDESDGEAARLSDGSSLWWAAAQLGGSPQSDKGAAGAGAGVTTADPAAPKPASPGLVGVTANALADECLAEWLKFFAGHGKEAAEDDD